MQENVSIKYVLQKLKKKKAKNAVKFNIMLKMQKNAKYC